MTVLALKLVTSEEIIGEAEKTPMGNFEIKNPVVVAVQQGPDGRAAIGFYPFMPYLGKDKKIVIEKDKVILSEEVDDQMKNQYNSVFGGIVTPPKQLIVG